MGVLENRFKDNIIVASLDKFLGWARSTSPWYFQFGLACCAIEMMASAASRHDLERIGMMPRSSPRQADVMIVAGTVTMKMALRVKKLYEQMADPKYVISMGSCATSGGPYWQHGYHVLKGVDLVVPVDVYVPGCPPRPEALIEGLLKLQEKIQTERPLTRKTAWLLLKLKRRLKANSPAPFWRTRIWLKIKWNSKENSGLKWLLS